MCDFVFGPCFVIKFLMFFLVLQHLAEEERTGFIQASLIKYKDFSRTSQDYSTVSSTES